MQVAAVDLRMLGATLVVDAVIAITVLEAALLVGHHWRTGKGVAPGDFAVNLVSGLCLMLALRAVLEGGGIVPMASWLLAAGLAHVTDLWRRWKR